MLSITSTNKTFNLTNNKLNLIAPEVLYKNLQIVFPNIKTPLSIGAAHHIHLHIPRRPSFSIFVIIVSKLNNNDINVPSDNNSYNSVTPHSSTLRTML